jgi:hypothetical protein
MSRWKSVKAKQLLAELLRIGWEISWQKALTAGSNALDGPTTHLPFMTTTRLAPRFLRSSPRRLGCSRRTCNWNGRKWDWSVA